jgi:CBS domain-containing protein
MTSNVRTTTAEAPVWDVARALLDNGFGGMPVVDASGTLVGMISGFDVISKTGAVVGDIMSRGVVWASPDDPLPDVVQLMGLHGIRRVPVCRDGQLLGIISRSDLLAWYTEEHENSVS